MKKTSEATKGEHRIASVQSGKSATPKTLEHPNHCHALENLRVHFQTSFVPNAA
jgi:hypothetical protein